MLGYHEFPARTGGIIGVRRFRAQAGEGDPQRIQLRRPETTPHPPSKRLRPTESNAYSADYSDAARALDFPVMNRTLSHFAATSASGASTPPLHRPVLAWDLYKKGTMLFYSLTIFLSAFLLFEVQPIIAKMILPWFGGSSAVWSTCMLFFQIVLLLGYLYAHWLNKLAPRRQAVVHACVLALSLATLPIIPNASWKSQGLEHPSAAILALLGLTVGLPYFLLSSTSPLLQAWYARTHKAGMPYRLFALSNFASMLALLTYPFLVEPNLPTRMQGTVWSGAFVCFAAICGLTAWRTSAYASTAADAAAEDRLARIAPGWSAR